VWQQGKDRKQPNRRRKSKRKRDRVLHQAFVVFGNDDLVIENFAEIVVRIADPVTQNKREKRKHAQRKGQQRVKETRKNRNREKKG
jgi:hypothetical protein